MEIWKDSKSKINRKKYNEWKAEYIARKCDPKPPKAASVFGPKMQIINAYKQNKNIEDAYKVADDINQKIGKEVYTKENVNSWIKEEIEKEKRMNKNKDEDSDAR